MRVKPGTIAWSADMSAAMSSEALVMLILQARVVDSTHLELSKPIDLQQGERIIVFLTEPGDEDVGQEMWLSVSAASLATAYGEAEPDYASTLVREFSPEYKG